MGVGVDQAGREDRVGAVEPLLRGVAAVDLGARSHVDDVIAADGDRAVLDHAALRVHGDYVARAPDRVDAGGGLSPRGRSEQQ